MQLRHIYAKAGIVHDASTVSVEAYYRAQSEHDVFHSALYSRCSPTKQNNCTVCYKTDTTNSLEVGEIYCFVSIKSLDEQTLIFAIITQFDTTHLISQVHK